MTDSTDPAVVVVGAHRARYSTPDVEAACPFPGCSVSWRVMGPDDMVAVAATLLDEDEPIPAGGYRMAQLGRLDHLAREHLDADHPGWTVDRLTELIHPEAVPTRRATFTDCATCGMVVRLGAGGRWVAVNVADRPQLCPGDRVRGPELSAWRNPDRFHSPNLEG